jgi:hypothetical protein
MCVPMMISVLFGWFAHLVIIQSKYLVI